MLLKLSKLTKTSVINPSKSIVFIFWNIFYHPMMKMKVHIVCIEPAYMAITAFSVYRY